MRAGFGVGWDDVVEEAEEDSGWCVGSALADGCRAVVEGWGRGGLMIVAVGSSSSSGLVAKGRKPPESSSSSSSASPSELNVPIAGFLLRLERRGSWRCEVSSSDSDSEVPSLPREASLLLMVCRMEWRVPLEYVGDGLLELAANARLCVTVAVDGVLEIPGCCERGEGGTLVPSAVCSGVDFRESCDDCFCDPVITLAGRL